MLARLPPPLRPRAHLPLLQTGPGLDHPAGAHPRAGRPLDLADPRRLHPAAAGPPDHRRRPVALGTLTADLAVDSDPHPPRFRWTAAGARHPGQPTETLRPLTIHREEPGCPGRRGWGQPGRPPF